MKGLTILLMTAFLSSPVLANKKHQCRKNYKEVSCKDIKDAKRESFCWKGKVSEKKKSKLCKRVKRMRKAKKTAMR